MTRIPELLAPAGGPEQLRYALAYGADAVYLASDHFGLRAQATNFAGDALPRAIAYAHERGARVHVACNAYLKDADMVDLPEYLRTIEHAGADAILVSDPGVAMLAGTYAPNTPLHVSTQASVSNAPAALAWHKLGATRVVCAREMSLDDIKRMREELGDRMEIEVFVHGAMCMAISGRCLISDHLTGRAANQGACTQPCRWEYEIVEPTRKGEHFTLGEDSHGSYLMNSQDMNMLAHLGEFAEVGVDSIKIEGRGKKAFYVATVVNAYRQVLDGADPAEFAPELETISHRPYSTGFFFGPAHQTIHNDNYVQTYDWVAQAEGSVPDGAGGWIAYVVCRNRFFEGNELEVLSPHRPIRRINVSHLAYRGFERTRDSKAFLEDAPATPVVTPGPEPCDTASRAMGCYQISSPFELYEDDILRVKRRDASHKN